MNTTVRNLDEQAWRALLSGGAPLRRNEPFRCRAGEIEESRNVNFALSGRSDGVSAGGTLAPVRASMPPRSMVQDQHQAIVHLAEPIQ